MLRAQVIVTRDAAELVLRRLDGLPRSDARERLHATVRECVREIERWNAVFPTSRERNALMTRLLGAHIEVTKLHRDDSTA